MILQHQPPCPALPNLHALTSVFFIFLLSGLLHPLPVLDFIGP